MNNINFFKLYILSFLIIFSVSILSISFFKILAGFLGKYDGRSLAKTQKYREWVSFFSNSLVLSFSILIFYSLWNLFNFSFSLNFWSVIGSFFIFALGGEIQYYSVHRMFHSKKLIRFHEKHHKSLVCNPETALSVSFFEVILLYFLLPFPIAFVASYFVLLSFWGLVFWCLIQFFLIAWLHSNLSIPDGKVKRFISNLGVMLPEDHSNHHLNHRVNYGLYCSFLDRFLNTNFRK